MDAVASARVAARQRRRRGRGASWRRPAAAHRTACRRRGESRARGRATAESLTEFGKGAARRLRRAHKIPAVLYGHGAEPVHVALPGHATMLALKHSNTLLTVELGGGRTTSRCPRTCSATPSAARSSTWTCSSCAGARGSPSTSRCTWSATPRRASSRPWKPIPRRLVVEAKDAQHPGVRRALDRGRRRRHPVPRRPGAAAGGATLAGDPDQIAVVFSAPETGREEEAAPEGEVVAEAAAEGVTRAATVMLLDAIMLIAPPFDVPVGSTCMIAT